MVELGKDGETSNVFGGVQFGGNENTSYFDNITAENGISGDVNKNVYQNINIEGDAGVNDSNIFRPVSADKAMTKKGFWSKVKEFLFQEIDLNAPIKVELTPYQQKVEREINEFLHQEISFKGLFKGSKNK